MSGIFPGSRTARFARVRLEKLDSAQDGLIWALVLWDETPRACALYLSDNQDEAPLLRLPVPSMDHLLAELRTALDQLDYTLHACGSCQHWRLLTPTDDALPPIGHCVWLHEDTVVASATSILPTQSGLALDCPHWIEATEAQPVSEIEAAPPALLRAAVEKKKEERATHSLWGQIKARFGGKAGNVKEDVPGGELRLLEQSGVGAGTEPCLACQGRIANLGARTKQTAEGDKETLSIWRCRECYTLYLNQWIDRWVRLDTLETVESYVRLAPTEAMMLLAGIEEQAGDDLFNTILTSRPPLSRQVKQGR